MAAVAFILFVCFYNFYTVIGLVEQDICNDNTLDSKQVFDLVAQGKEWLTIALVYKNLHPLVRSVYYNPKFKFTTEKVTGRDEEIDMQITAFSTSWNDCVHFDYSSLTPEDKETEIDETCQLTTGRSSDTFAVLRSPNHPQQWLRLFSQSPEDYAWVLFCGNTTGTGYDWDSCLQGHIDLFITDPRSEITDSFNLQEKVSALSGLIATDDTIYIGNSNTPVYTAWVEGDAEKECSFDRVK